MISGTWGEFKDGVPAPRTIDTEAAPAGEASGPAGESAELAAAAPDGDAVADGDAGDAAEPEDDGTHGPLADGSMPDGYPIKGETAAKVFHAPGSRNYEATEAEIWFASIDAATAAGYTPAAAQADTGSEDE